MDDDALTRLLARAADAVAASLTDLADWGEAGTRPGQYHHDLAADAAATSVLVDAGVGVVSEESGGTDADADLVVVVDPVDGSTNASYGIPWFATSLCAVDAEGMRAALVVNLATGTRFEAVRGKGARRNGALLPRRDPVPLERAIVGISGLPSAHPGWRQFRALGAIALDLCAVASGSLDAFVDCSVDAHGPWDYLGGLLVCRETGVDVADARGRELVVVDPAARRTPIAATDPTVGADLAAALHPR